MENLVIARNTDSRTLAARASSAKRVLVTGSDG